MSSGGTDKKTLRHTLRRRLRSLDPQTRQQASVEAARHLTGTDLFARARVIMVFLPLSDEIDARPVVRTALEAGKTVAVPRVTQERGRMRPVEVRSLDEPMDVDAHGVASPRRGQELVLATIDLVVVPGLGFDRGGGRLGRGAGYYDRFLADPRLAATSCGLAFETQLVPELPQEDHDIRVDMLVTDQGVRDLRPTRP
ncbi:MAG: 5-formyltetrahydrofolate cyclo-ligase [Phycisphaerae bacterium]|nr:5-formyltetrahydrofolate cyclo-ligase [Phycisphaerae bacterium]